MGPTNRRALIGGCAAVTTAVLAGCPGDPEESPRPDSSSDSPREREYDAENPFSVVLTNEADRGRTVAVEISRNGDTVYEDTIEVGAGEHVTVAEYETTGRYTIRAETGDRRMETSAEIERENLVTHRSAFCRIAVDADGVLVEVVFED